MADAECDEKMIVIACNSPWPKGIRTTRGAEKKNQCFLVFFEIVPFCCHSCHVSVRVPDQCFQTFFRDS